MADYDCKPQTIEAIKKAIVDYPFALSDRLLDDAYSVIVMMPSNLIQDYEDKIAFLKVMTVLGMITREKREEVEKQKQPVSEKQ